MKTRVRHILHGRSPCHEVRRPRGLLLTPGALRVLTTVSFLVVGTLFGPRDVVGGVPARWDRLAFQYSQEIQPMIQEFCLGCHSTAARFGDLDLERGSTLSE